MDGGVGVTPQPLPKPELTEREHVSRFLGVLHRTFRGELFQAADVAQRVKAGDQRLLDALPPRARLAWSRGRSVSLSVARVLNQNAEKDVGEYGLRLVEARPHPIWRVVRLKDAPDDV